MGQKKTFYKLLLIKLTGQGSPKQALQIIYIFLAMCTYFLVYLKIKLVHYCTNLMSSCLRVAYFASYRYIYYLYNSPYVFGHLSCFHLYQDYVYSCM